MLAHSFFDRIIIKVAGNQTGIKSRTSSILGLWFPWPIYTIFEMRFDLGTLDSGERSLSFGLIVLYVAAHFDPYFTLNLTCTQMHILIF